jgi:hypothetical protein
LKSRNEQLEKELNESKTNTGKLQKQVEISQKEKGQNEQHLFK